jgi:predicted HTH domain antitoxin
MILQIPESIISAVKFPETEIEQELKNIIAVNLYFKGMLGFGKARQLAGLSKYQFGILLTTKGIPRNYTINELKQDIEYANS